MNITLSPQRQSLSLTNNDNPRENHCASEMDVDVILATTEELLDLSKKAKGVMEAHRIKVKKIKELARAHKIEEETRKKMSQAQQDRMRTMEKVCTEGKVASLIDRLSQYKKKTKQKMTSSQKHQTEEPQQINNPVPVKQEAKQQQFADTEQEQKEKEKERQSKKQRRKSWQKRERSRRRQRSEKQRQVDQDDDDSIPEVEGVNDRNNSITNDTLENSKKQRCDKTNQKVKRNNKGDNSKITMPVESVPTAKNCHIPCNESQGARSTKNRGDDECMKDAKLENTNANHESISTQGPVVLEIQYTDEKESSCTPTVESTSFDYVNCVSVDDGSVSEISQTSEVQFEIYSLEGEKDEDWEEYPLFNSDSSGSSYLTDDEDFDSEFESIASVNRIVKRVSVTNINLSTDTGKPKKSCLRISSDTSSTQQKPKSKRTNNTSKDDGSRKQEHKPERAKSSKNIQLQHKTKSMPSKQKEVQRSSSVMQLIKDSTSSTKQKQNQVQRSSFRSILTTGSSHSSTQQKESKASEQKPKQARALSLQKNFKHNNSCDSSKQEQKRMRSLSFRVGTTKDASASSKQQKEPVTESLKNVLKRSISYSAKDKGKSSRFLPMPTSLNISGRQK